MIPITAIRLGIDIFDCNPGRSAGIFCTAEIAETTSNGSFGSTMIGSATPSLTFLGKRID